MDASKTEPFFIERQSGSEKKIDNVNNVPEPAQILDYANTVSSYQ